MYVCVCFTLYVACTQQRGLLSCPAVTDRGCPAPLWAPPADSTVSLCCQDKSGPGIQSASHWDKWHSTLIILSSLVISLQHNSYNFPVTSAEGTHRSLFKSHSFQSEAVGWSGDLFSGEFNRRWKSILQKIKGFTNYLSYFAMVFVKFQGMLCHLSGWYDIYKWVKKETVGPWWSCVLLKNRINILNWYDLFYPCPDLCFLLSSHNILWDLLLSFGGSVRHDKNPKQRWLTI